MSANNGYHERLRSAIFDRQDIGTTFDVLADKYNLSVTPIHRYYDQWANDDPDSQRRSYKTVSITELLAHKDGQRSWQMGKKIYSKLRYYITRKM